MAQNYTKFYSPEIKGFCKTTKGSEYSGYNSNEKIKINFSHKIYALNGIPEIYLASTVAHEIMHAWITENTGDKMSSQVIEGACNFASYLYLKDINNPDSRLIIKRLEINRNNTYGTGYRNIYSEFAEKPVIEFLKYLKAKHIYFEN